MLWCGVGRLYLLHAEASAGMMRFLLATKLQTKMVTEQEIGVRLTVPAPDLR